MALGCRDPGLWGFRDIGFRVRPLASGSLGICKGYEGMTLGVRRGFCRDHVQEALKWELKMIGGFIRGYIVVLWGYVRSYRDI